MWRDQNSHADPGLIDRHANAGRADAAPVFRPALFRAGAKQETPGAPSYPPRPPEARQMPPVAQSLRRVTHLIAPVPRVPQSCLSESVKGAADIWSRAM